MPTEVWFRNPQGCVKECIEAGATRTVWDRGYIAKKRIDPYNFLEMYYPAAMRWEAMLVGEQGATHIDRDNPVAAPLAVYPVWWYGHDSLALLEEMLANPVGEDDQYINDPSTTRDLRPVKGQQHRVVVSNLPLATTGFGKELLRQIAKLQEEYPDAIVHLHESYSFRVMFGLGFRSADFEPRANAKGGSVFLPNGKKIEYTKASNDPKWVHLVGMRTEQLEQPRERCLFNIKSALWAGENFATTQNFAIYETVNTAVKEVPTKQAMMVAGTPLPRGKVVDGDKFLCDVCSVQTQCKYYREGQVCAIPGSEPAPLAAFFKTRDSDRIIDGLGTLMALNSRRIEAGAQDEIIEGELDPRLTKLVHDTFDQGVKLAKLVNPSLARASASIQQNVNVLAAGGYDPRAAVAQAMAALESQGIPRDQITPEMMESLIVGKTPAAIEARLVEEE